MDYFQLAVGLIKISAQLQMPTDSSWSNALDALRKAIDLENEVLESIHEVHLKAEHECKDPHVSSWRVSETSN